MTGLRAFGMLVVVGTLGCGSRPPPAAPLPPVAVNQSLSGMGRVEMKAAFQDSLMRALKPKVLQVDQVTGYQYRYRVSAILGRSKTITIYIARIGSVEVVKGTRVYVYERSANPRKKGKARERIRFATPAEALRHKELVEYVIGPEFQAIAAQEKEAAFAAARRPDPDPTPPAPAPGAEACVVCGEPRGDVSPCLSCGTD